MDRWAGRVDSVDFSSELALQRWLRRRIAHGELHSALDLSGGGLAVALARACLRGSRGPLGCLCEASDLGSSAAAWFGETGATALISCAPDLALELSEAERSAGLRLLRLGHVADAHRGMRAGPLALRLDELTVPWRQSATRLVSGPPLGADFPLHVRDICHR